MVSSPGILLRTLTDSRLSRGLPLGGLNLSFLPLIGNCSLPYVSLIVLVWFKKKTLPGDGRPSPVKGVAVRYQGSLMQLAQKYLANLC